MQNQNNIIKYITIHIKIFISKYFKNNKNNR